MPTTAYRLRTSWRHPKYRRAMRLHHAPARIVLVLVPVLAGAPAACSSNSHSSEGSHGGPDASASGSSSGSGSSGGTRAGEGGVDGGGDAAQAAAPSSPVISHNVPAYANYNYPGQGANLANSGQYGYPEMWRSNQTPSSSTPNELTYDISGVSSAQKKHVVSVWYNESFGYDDSAGSSYSEPGAYEILGNTAPGGTSMPPTSGWMTLATVTSNALHSRQNDLGDISEYNWVQLKVTGGAPNNQPMNTDVEVNWDLHDVSQGFDDWIIYGDAITALSLAHGQNNACIPKWAAQTAYAATVANCTGGATAAPPIVVGPNGGVYELVTAGTSGSTGPTGTGSSISDGSVVWRFVIAGTNYDFSQMVNASNPKYFPAQENGGSSDPTLSQMAAFIEPQGKAPPSGTAYLSLFPGKYVGIALGTNDASSATACLAMSASNAQTWYESYVTLINSVISAGKVPVVATVPYRTDSMCSSTGRSQSNDNTVVLNYMITGQTTLGTLVMPYTPSKFIWNLPGVVHGPDLYGFFAQKQNQHFISDNGGLHPSGAGQSLLRNLWAQAALANVY
jgi:lysophospholipase L1-like esterase